MADVTPAEALAWAVGAAERHEDHMARWVDSGLPPVAQRRRNHQDAVEVVAGLRECCRLLGIEQPPVVGGMQPATPTTTTTLEGP